jgi:hypothetical protein
MRRLLRSLAAPLGLIGLMTAGPAAGDNPISDELEITAIPYMWFLELNGNATVKGQKGDVDVGFSDIWDNLNIGAMFEGEVRKGRMGIYGNIIYADLESENSVSGVDIKADATTVWAGAGAFYRLGPWNLDALGGSGGAPRLFVDPYAGVRYTYLDLDLDVKNGGPDFSGDQDWVDPVIGFRTVWRFTPRWTFTTIGDIGGFGVGSDFSWQAVGLIGYNFSIFQESDSRLLLGYRALSQDYKDGSGADKFEWDVIAHGPTAGLAIRF